MEINLYDAEWILRSFGFAHGESMLEEEQIEIARRIFQYFPELEVAYDWILKDAG